MNSTELSLFFRDAEQVNIIDRYLLEMIRERKSLQVQLQQQNQKIKALEQNLTTQYQNIVNLLTNEHKPEQSHLKTSTKIKQNEDVAVWVDRKHHLMWSKISIGQIWKNGRCEGDAISLEWKDAVEACKKFHLAEFYDWRLPSIDELQTLLTDTAGYACPQHTLCKPKHDHWGRYWSTSSTENNEDFAWIVNFNLAQSSMTNKNNPNPYVRLVRDHDN